MVINNIINEILTNNTFPESITTWNKLSGGTNSSVIVIGSNTNPRLYVVKSNTPEQIRCEVDFLLTYKSISKLPTIRYVDRNFDYYIYEYIPGQTSYHVGQKQEVLTELIEQMLHFYIKATDVNQYEWIENPDTVANDVRYSRSVIGQYLSEKDHQIVWQIHLQRSVRKSQQEGYLLHGDYGVHNFIFENRKLTGVIDPIPKIGPKRFDLLYAFCSSPDHLYLPILLPLIEFLEGDFNQLEVVEDMLLALYSRISTCLHHHPKDMNQYLLAWSEWTKIYNELS